VARSPERRASPTHEDTQKERMLIDSREPVPNVHIGARTLAQFGENVCVDEEAFHKAIRRPKRRGRTNKTQRPRADGILLTKRPQKPKNQTGTANRAKSLGFGAPTRLQ
jgi:hypothetical protein